MKSYIVINFGDFK